MSVFKATKHTSVGAHAYPCVTCANVNEWKRRAAHKCCFHKNREGKKRGYGGKNTSLYNVTPNSATTACACVFISERRWLSADVVQGSGSVSSPVTRVRARFGALMSFYGVQCKNCWFEAFCRLLMTLWQEMWAATNSVVFTLCFTFLESFLKEALHYKWTNTQREDATVRKRRSGETYRLGGFDEDLGAAELELILIHVDRP